MRHDQKPRCPVHGTVLIHRFDETSRPGLMIETDEMYCLKCEQEHDPWRKHAERKS